MIHALTETGNIMERAITRLLKVHTGEVMAVVHSLWWGIWAWRSTLVDVPTGFTTLEKFAPIWVQGSISISLALLCVASHFLEKPRLLRIGLFSAFIWSLFLAICFFMINPLFAAVPTYGSLAVVYGFAYFKERVRGPR